MNKQPSGIRSSLMDQTANPAAGARHRRPPGLTVELSSGGNTVAGSRPTNADGASPDSTSRSLTNTYQVSGRPPPPCPVPCSPSLPTRVAASALHQ